MSPWLGPSMALCGSSTKLDSDSGMPVIAARLPLVAVHALLHDGPMAVIGDEEAVQVEVEAILHGGAVDLGDQAAGPRQRRRVDADTIAEGRQLIRRAPGMLAAAAADMDAELALQGRQAALRAHRSRWW